MAAAKTGISASIQDSKEISDAYPMFSGSGNSVVLLVMLYLETGSEKFKMAAAKPELHVSQLRYKIAKKFIVFSGTGNSMTPLKGSMSKRKWHIWLLNVVILFLNCMHGKLVDKLPPSRISDSRFLDVALQKAPQSSSIQKYADGFRNFYAEIQVLPVQCRQLNFSLLVSTRSLPDSATDLFNPKNMQIAVGTSLLSCKEADIQVHPV
jgi:hypothetical protein